MSQLFNSNRACVILTGASRGFGHTLAVLAAEKFHQQFPLPGSADGKTSPPLDRLLFVLIARDGARLKSLAEQLRSIDSRIDVQCIECDLSKKESIDTIENQLRVIRVFEQNIDHFILFHNAGSTGSHSALCKNVLVTDAAERDAYYRLNLYSVMELTGVFLRMSEQDCVQETQIRRNIVNISSLAAVKPIRGTLDYCVGKAARKAYFENLASEIADETKHDGPNNFHTRVLSYSPGPLKTDMFDRIQREGITQEQFKQITPLTTTESGEKLYQILTEDSYENGQHIDFFNR